MARPLSIAELATVPVNGSFVVRGKPHQEVRRKADLYGKRHNRQFHVFAVAEGVQVTRLPDPEQAEAA